MPITSPIGRKGWSQRLFVWFIYASLTFFGATMAVPFLITVTSSTTNSFDYDRFSILPRTLWSKEDRMVKTLPVFMSDYPGWHEVMRYHFPEVPLQWTSWRSIGLDYDNVKRLADPYLQGTDEDRARRRIRAADYAEFALQYPLGDSRLTVSNVKASRFMERRYEAMWEEENAGLAASASSREKEEGALRLIGRDWGVPVERYNALNFMGETRAPMGQQSFAPQPNSKRRDYLALAHAVQHGFGVPGILPAWEKFLDKQGLDRDAIQRLSPLPPDATGEENSLWLKFARNQAPASPAVPFPMHLKWIEYLSSDAVRERLQLNVDQFFNVALFNKLAGTTYASLVETPFPLPAEGFDALRPVWNSFLQERYPLRLTRVVVSPALQNAYEQFLQNRYSPLESFNQWMGTDRKSWAEFVLQPEMPDNPKGATVGICEVWMDFVKSLPAEQKQVRSSESAFQDFLRTKYGTIADVNRVYGWNLGFFEEAKPPFADAWAETYGQHKTAFAFAPVRDNYGTILDFLVRQGNAIPVTLWLILLSISATLTINPIAAYALSRFNLKGKDKIILFCLATAAFPAMVSAIPGYLLMRDLGLLNTFFALILPGAANGMAIFILKGFYDSLPPELFEAATIDGAKEWQIFIYVTLPMIKPILAINALNAFMHAYSSWEWALIICQKKSMWTLSVWLYQASQWWADQPWITTAGFVIASIPTLIVFLFCQKIIMRGIIVPSMK